MSLGTLILVILLVLGVVVGNLMLLKHSAKFKFPTTQQKPPPNKPNNGDDDDD